MGLLIRVKYTEFIPFELWVFQSSSVIYYIQMILKRPFVHGVLLIFLKDLYEIQEIVILMVDLS